MNKLIKIHILGMICKMIKDFIATFDESIINSIFTGIISGLFSGIIITNYYRMLDSRSKNISEFKESRYEYYKYIREVENELELLLKKQNFVEMTIIPASPLQQNTRLGSKSIDIDLDDIQRLLKNIKGFSGIRKVDITEDSEMLLGDVADQLNKIEQAIDDEILSCSFLKKEIRNLYKLRIEFLKTIKMKEYKKTLIDKIVTKPFLMLTLFIIMLVLLTLYCKV